MYHNNHHHGRKFVSKVKSFGEPEEDFLSSTMWEMEDQEAWETFQIYKHVRK